MISNPPITNKPTSNNKGMTGSNRSVILLAFHSELVGWCDSKMAGWQNRITKQID